MTVTQTAAGESFPRRIMHGPARPTVPAGVMIENTRSALGRGLPEVKWCKPHGHVLSVAGGGPSLDETHKNLTGYVAAINGSLSFLMEKGIVPNACGVLDANPHIAEMLVPHQDVTYFVASVCDPSVFDRLMSCHVVLWHPSSRALLTEPVLDEHGHDWLQIGGGSTMGLRWLNLGYVCGFRKFHLHGLDSSFRSGKTHAYPDRRDESEHLTVCGYETRLNFLHQVTEFAALLALFQQPDVEPVDIEVFGDGLLQANWRAYQEVRGRMSPQEAFQRWTSGVKEVGGFLWPIRDRDAAKFILQEAQGIDRVLSRVAELGTAVQAGGNVGVYPKKLAERFTHVVTAEPDAENFRCLTANLAGIGNVRAIQAAVGDSAAKVGMMRDTENVGAHYIDGEGEIPQTKIDELGLTACDLIYLDVEGYELKALRGATQTIEKFKPVVAIEDKGHAARYGDDQSASGWLAEKFGYRIVDRVGNDLVLVA